MLKFFSFRGVVLFFVIPVSLFVGMMIATAGTAFWPPLTALATPLICGGEVEYESQSWSYRPGEQGVSRSIYCTQGEAREDITMSAIGMSFLVYSTLAFAGLFLLALAMRGRFRRADENPLSGFGIKGPSQAPSDLGSILAAVSEAVERGDARVVVRGPAESQPDDPGERLVQLKGLLERFPSPLHIA